MTPTSADTRLLWNEIVRWTFEACILRREGEEAKVSELLCGRLPALIQVWSRGCQQPPEECKQQLRALFARAQESVEVGYIQRRLIVEEVCSRLGRANNVPNADLRVPAREDGKSAPAGVHLRRRIPLEDVPGMLDALAEAEGETFAESVLPIRRSIAPHMADFPERPAAQVALTA